ncbi:MAG: hypothetical protein V4506_19785 [Bacteroidota bacterium]
MKTILIILLSLISIDFYSQKRIDWESVQIFQFTSTEYPFGKKHNTDTTYAVGEMRIKIKSNPKSLADLSDKNMIELKKSLAKIGAKIVYLDLTNLHDMNNQEKKEFYILYLTTQK